MDSYRAQGSSHLIQVRNINREMLEKALELRCASYLADVKAALLVRTVTSVGESKRYVSDVNTQLQRIIEQRELEVEARLGAEAKLRRISEAIDRAPIMVALFAGPSRVYANLGFVAAFADAEHLTCAVASEEQRVQAAVTNGTELVAELELSTPSGSFWGRVRVSPGLDGGDGPVVGLFIEDVTKEREVAEQLHRSQRLDAIGQLTGGIAHDFNNVLGVIQANAELLLAHKPGLPDPRVLSQAIVDAVKHAAALTSQLLAFGRRQTLRAMPVDVVGLIENLARMIRRTIGEAYSLELELGRYMPLVLCDPGPLEAALLNLVLNARDASAPGSVISISISHHRVDAERGSAPRKAHYGPPLEPGAYLRISVSDQGSGIAPELLDRIWEPFVSTKSNDNHSGMGLSMVLGFAAQSGGAIEIVSEVGSGTTIDLLLPRAPTPACVDDEPVGPSILVVEDEPALRQGIALALEYLGYRALTAETLQDAVALLDAQHVDCLMTDMVLAHGGTGLDVAKAARERQPSLPVLFVSGYPRSVLDGFELPADSEVLAKPFSIDVVGQVLARLLGRE